MYSTVEVSLHSRLGDALKPFSEWFEGKNTSLFNFYKKEIVPASSYMFKVKNRNTRTRCEICSKLTIKIPERRHWRRSGIFIVNFEHILHFVLVFLLLTLTM